jgi:hypothetical protein
MAVDDGMSETAHEGTVTQRLDRLETSVSRIVRDIEDIKEKGGERRSTDEMRLRKVEDQLLVWNTRWQTIDTMLTRVFGVSIIGAVASIIAIVATVIALVNGVGA